MLSTTANSKVKNLKGAENSDISERDETGHENTTNDKVRGYVASYDASSSFGGPSRDGRFRSRGRVSEFRHSRGGGRGGRARGGFPPRGDRDPLDNSSKYNESLSHANNETWFQENVGNNKFYERSDLVVNLPEDPRISKLLRRLCAEVDIEKSLVICSKLQDAVMLPENARYIRRAYDILVESLLDVLYDGPGPETKEGAAVVLGRIGYVMGPDFRKHLDWFTATYSVHNTSIKHLLTLSFSETLQLDFQTPNLSDFAEMTLERMQNVIEGTDSADVFIAAINAMIIMSNSYPEHFATHFVDTVDILVGWHVDSAQPKKIKDFALQSLLKLSCHWQADVGFSVNLLYQFVEDMVAYSADLDMKSDKDSEQCSLQDSMQKITSFLNVFKTVVKSLGSMLNPSVTQSVSWSFLTDALTKIIQVMTKTLKEDVDIDLILSGNEAITLLMKHLQSKSTSSSQALFGLILMEMENYLVTDDSVCLSTINLISTTIKEIASNLPIEFINQTIGPDSLLRSLRYSENSQILNAILLLYINLLNLKNIPLLQESYKYVLTDIQNAYCKIIPDVLVINPEYTEEMTIDDAEKNIIFYLQCLSELANASNSIIGMWALQPSILELLAIKMCPQDMNLMKRKPALQYSVLYLLYSHCKKNNHFIASSDLVNNPQQRATDIFNLSNINLGEVSSSSPTSGHLAVILNTLSMILDEEVPKETLLLILNWISDIFHQLDNYLSIVRTRWITEFMMFLEKYIYNAAEGTATVLPAVAKPVRTFFHTNWSTCREWLTRVRPAALAVSIYAGNIGAAIYHACLILQTAANSNTNIDIEAIAISAAKVLIKIGEPEVLHGLYVWIKQTFNKRLPWLKGAAEHANSRHELAIDYYKKLQGTQEQEDSNESLNQNDTRANKFIEQQLMESYKQIQSWEDLLEWRDNEKQQNLFSPSYSTLKMFEDGIDMPEELCNWDVLNIDANEISKNTCSYQGMLNKIESTLLSTALNMYYSDYTDKYEKQLKVCKTLLNSSTEEFARTNSVHFLKEVAVLQLANHGLIEAIKNGKNGSNPFKPSSVKDLKYGTEFKNLSRILWWSQYFSKLNLTEENLFYTECLRLDVIKSARKNLNIKMAKRELLKHFKNNSAFQMCLGNVNNLDDFSDVLLISTNSYDFDIWTLNNATALVELCKLTYVKEETKLRAINLCASISLGFSQRLAMDEPSYELREKGTRMLLTLSKWVQSENENVLDPDTPLMKLISALPEIGLVDNNISENVIPLSDSAVGKLLQFGVNQCPGLAKAWANFAAWCFRWGRKMVEFSAKTREQLTEKDKLQIESVMIGCSPQDFEAVCEILSKTKATCDDEDIDWNEINTSEMIESQLRTVPSLSNAFPEHLALLVDIWRQAQKRVFSYFELSADAYFKFLQLICASDYINHSGENAVVNATLRLLRLIVKHAMELQTVLESGLANTPTQPWKVIIPQLFSRLNHPETYVRKCVSDLLCRLAEDTPHLITFPAVVGAVENEQNELTELKITKLNLSNDAESGDENLDFDDASSDKVVNNELNSCFLDMVETLSKQAPTTILQVKLLVKELQRINLLWDELCLGTLVQHHSDFSKRLSQLETEVAKVQNNVNLNAEEKEKLIAEKHRIIFEPIVYVLEQLDNITSAKPETPHETSFQNKFKSLIKDVIDKLKNPGNPEKPQESWAPLKQLQIKLQQKVHKRTSYILKMSDISPVLAEMKNTVITMPGLHTNQRAVRVTIKSIENNVAILPTKTRPKKLVFYGSDGKTYTYLFKGLEDLHLDERIMQLLSITNTMLARDSENNDNQTYRARHYSVIPLGPRSGLISWVDNVTPLFALYKRWQNREAAIMSAKTNKTVNVLRPSELFYNKLNPLLKEAGISTENRKEWPVAILKQVLQELSAETPRDLLWRELWCSSVTPEQWWQMTRRYSYSVAVMSAIGYIIGLGDRHLDNVLVDLTSGEVVHIDYNVCFEKGKTLRVPEKVPFRMTPNLVAPLNHIST
ncbi:unnamed protein product [Chilo suppressalis]|uniref:non-specific serine/threonine protein kinase n=1 Tax=Chilo suppressalis TaxID=168631 RepID=A0ABN8AWL4_CHISP|nr:unnamed protein product [Chilo suppressalis]